MSIEVLLICGSFHKRSANRAVLDVARGYLSAQSHVQVTESIGLDTLVAVNPALFDPLPSTAQAFRSQVDRANAVIIAGPEYAGGLAGSLKNALDWCVGSAVGFYSKPVVVMSAGTSGGTHALRQLAQTLLWQGAHVLGDLGIARPKTKSDSSGAIVDPRTKRSIEELAELLLDATSMDAEVRATKTHEYAQRAGIQEYPHVPR